ncbi:hypothetical protein FHS63_004811 [Azospirillum doebereinerae]
MVPDLPSTPEMGHRKGCLLVVVDRKKACQGAVLAVMNALTAAPDR